MKIKAGSALIALLLLCIHLPFASSQRPLSGATAYPDHVTLTWTGSSSKTMTVTWRTDVSVTEGWVQYEKGVAFPPKAAQIRAKSRDFVSDLGPARIFTATMTGLAPDTAYSYRAGDGMHWSEPQVFRTAGLGTTLLKFLIFGDSQSSLTGIPPYGVWRDTVRQAYRTHPDARFMVNMGDLVDIGQQASHWNAWFSSAEGVINRIPIMPVSGNHESYGSPLTAKPQYFIEQFTLPQNGPEGLKNTVYSYDAGPVHFVVLDSQQEEQRKYGDILKKQQEWLEADLAASKAPWKIAFFHRSPYETQPLRNEAEVRNAFCPILEKHHVNLVFTAHDHAVARTPPLKYGEVMNSPAQGTIYLISGQSGGKTYPNNIRKKLHSFFYNPLDQPNYWAIEVTRKEIRIKAVKQDGTFIDGFRIDRTGKFEEMQPPEIKKAA
jgi:acid phosphatase type 7